MSWYVKKYAEIVIETWDDDTSLYRETELFMHEWPRLAQLFQKNTPDAIDELSDILSERFISSLKILIDKNVKIDGIFKEILSQLKTKFVFVTIKSAKPLDEATQLKFENALKDKYQQNIYLTVEVNPQLIGGMVVIAPNEIIKGSLINRINNLTQCLKN